MPVSNLRANAELPSDFADRLAALRAELDIPGDFPDEVSDAAERATRVPTSGAGPSGVGPDRVDRTELGLITIDPQGSRDLDQAVHLRRDGDGFVVSYAIADVGAFVEPGGPLDLESHRRGLTLYAPDRRTLLYPPALSEGGASLLAGLDRPALLWTIRLDADGVMGAAEVVRALVRSRAQLSYDQAQLVVDTVGDAYPASELSGALTEDEITTVGGPEGAQTLSLLRIVGRLRLEQERRRGGVSLDLPEQEIEQGPDGWRLAFRASLPVEAWNAQISLLTGMAAARIQLDGVIGVLRTLPPAEPGAVQGLRLRAKALGLDWPDSTDYPGFVDGLDPARPAEAAMLTACTRLFRGAGYQAFDATLPEQTEHAAIAAPYAHTTAPLRRLVDRYVGEICLALSAGRPVPEWVHGALAELPAEMTTAERLQKHYERALLDLTEVFVLAGRVGQTFTGTVIEVEHSGRRGTLMIADPAVEAKIAGEDLPLGQTVQAVLVSADPNSRTVSFELA